MKRSFLVMHWLLTVCFSPLIALFFSAITGLFRTETLELISVYPIVFIFGLAYSLPAFGCYLFAYSLLEFGNAPPLIAKTVLILVSVLSIIITMNIIGGSSVDPFKYIYSLGAITTGSLLKISKTKKDKEDNTIPC